MNKKEIIETLNKTGFILEDKTYSILTKKNHFNQIYKNFDFTWSNTRFEVDILGELDNFLLFIDCKKSEYLWYFPKEINQKNMYSCFTDGQKGIKISNKETDIPSVYSDISLKEEKSKPKPPQQEIHSKIFEFLKLLEAYLCWGIRFKDKYLIPIIVTNTDLYIVEYNSEKLDDYGNLTEENTNLEKVDYLIYNLGIELRWDNAKQIIYPEFNDNRLNSQNNKSVFIVNVKSLPKFIDKIKGDRYYSVNTE